MVNRWGTAVLALAIFATPLAAQEPSLENTEPVEERPVLPDDDTPAPAIPADEADGAAPDSATTDSAAEPDFDETFEDFSLEPTVDVTELRATVAETLPTSAPPPPMITNILPANTPAAMIVNTRQDAWEVLNQYALFAQLSESFGVPPSPQSLPLLPWGIDYTEDIDPWIGDSVALALLPVPSIRTINPVERSLTIVPINDAAAFIDFIPKLAEVRNALPEQTSYRTFPIWHWSPEFVPYDYPWNDFPEEDIELQEFPEVPPPSGLNSYRRDPDLPYIYIPDGNYSDEGYTLPGYAVAHLGNYIIMAENIDSVRQWIEYQTQGGPKLTSNPSFEKTQSHPESQNSLATVYGNVGQLLNFEFSNPFQTFGLPPIPQPSLSDRAAMSNLLSNVTFDVLIYPQTQGMHLEAHLYTEGALPDLPPSPNADHSILGLIPAATYAMGSGYDISGFWNDVSSAFSLNDVSGGLIETARSIVALATGLDLDTDILGWMDGEYSLFLFPSQSGFLNSFFPGLGLEAGVILETSNRPAAEAALEALDDVIGEDAVVSTTIANAPVVNWQYDVNLDGTMDSVLTHTWITDDTLAFTSGKGAMERLVVPAGFNPLNGHSTFRNATASFPNPNNGYFYVNMGSTLSFFYNLFGFNQATDPWAVDIRSYFGTVRSLSVTTSSSAQEFQIDALLGLATSEPMVADLEEEELDAEEKIDEEKSPDTDSE
ncbi:DUF3352 domain-containing protein [Leptolyngbya cf. ectocarpi LEGE 11479]|uniref:DUF3352 domain-containing protein n=1 Tax=Leptolyngbya cf. ectocarpi LEGE 11479 TaxID=1828722 RepID=A0A928X398_LEPEC|nr:DUF3352 domain-containing protein [Leptolyngbya ectocarpi]MBE9066556.1 DUF3352 domain-containing protein [Leptolyngbya cf. ectocarpi LEGE 11479]